MSCLLCVCHVSAVFLPSFCFPMLLPDVLALVVLLALRVPCVSRASVWVLSGELFPMMRNDGEHSKEIPEWESFVGEPTARDRKTERLRQ